VSFHLLIPYCCACCACACAVITWSLECNRFLLPHFALWAAASVHSHWLLSSDLPLTVVSCVGRFRPARHTGHSGCRLAYLGTTEQSGRRPALEYIPARSPVRVGECNGAFSFIIVVHGREELISECLLPDDLIGSRVIRSIALVLIRRQNFMPRVARAVSDSIARALSEVLDDYARIYFSSCAMSPTQSPRLSAMILH
jgi:hypothetical protein